MQLDQTNPIELGEKLRLARETSDITQADAAGEIGIARTTLVAIERGGRRVKLQELVKLARLYNSTTNSFLRQEAIHVDLVPKFRRQIASQDDIAEKAAEIMANLAKAEVELENLLGIRRSQNYPPERQILPGDVCQQAEQDALELRQWLGLGQNPIHDIIAILEIEMGVRVYVRKLNSRVSGLFAYEESLGACILLNASHPLERRLHTAAHELGHFVATRKMPEVLFEDETINSREERYADAFARTFLMPSRALQMKFQEITAGASQFTRRHIIILAKFFRVSREALVWRLEELKAVKRGTWDWFQRNGGITDSQALEVLGDLAIARKSSKESERPTTYRLNSLICQVWKQELLSEGQLSQLLHIDRHELREILDCHDLDGSDADGAPILLN